MKKKIVLTLAVALTLSVAGTALAAPIANPFVGVPAKHWAYDAVNQLAKAGVISGFGDGTYKGDKTLTRYEVAVIVAKALATDQKLDAQTKAALDKLQAEFSAELSNMGVRVSNLEKKVSNVKFGGDARIRYQENFGLQGNDAGASNVNRIQNRIRLTANGQFDDNWSVSIRFGVQNNIARSKVRINAVGGTPATGATVTTTAYDRASQNGAVFFDRAEFKWTKGNVNATIGRSSLWLGQGVLYDLAADAVSVNYKADKLTVKALVGDSSPTKTLWGQSSAGEADTSRWTESQKFWATDFGYNLTNTVNLTATLYQSTSKAYPYKNWAVGSKTKFGDFTLTSEYVKNTYDFAANKPAGYVVQDKGYWFDLLYKGADTTKPGTWGVNVRYEKLGKDAFDAIPTTLNYASNSHGIDGYEVGVNYVFAKGANFKFFVGKYKPYDANEAGFDKYNTAYTAAAYFAF